MITNIIEKHYASLTPAEKKIAAHVLKHPKESLGQTVNGLAKTCGTAPSAVVRFCKSIGVDGFSQFKIALAKQIGGQEQQSLPAFHREDSAEHIVQKVFRIGAETLTDTCNMVDVNRIDRMAKVLEKAKRIFIFGIGTSSVIAVDAQYRLTQIGLWATAYTDILFMNVSASQASAEDVVLAISHSGRTKAVVDAVRTAKKGGAKILSLTSFSESPLYQESDLAVAAYADEKNYPVEAVSARLSHLCLIDAITLVLATKNYESFTRHIETRNQVLEQIRYKGDNHEKNNFDIH